VNPVGRYLRFGAAITVIVLALAYLAFTGIQESKSYYVTIAELQGMGPKAQAKRLRVAGTVVPGSIHRHGTGADFQLDENGLKLQVSYRGSEPPPDTFKDSSLALAEGNYGADGVFHAQQVQAKCASKYAPANKQPAPAASPAKGAARADAQNPQPASAGRVSN
jgi:cytochrome c-type biogenesis protein CcmE